jgi:hypothetical protein
MYLILIANRNKQIKKLQEAGDNVAVEAPLYKHESSFSDSLRVN